MRLSLSASDIYLDNRHVGSLKPDLYATLIYDVEMLLDAADVDAIPESVHADKVKVLEDEIANTGAHYENELSLRDEQIAKLENENDELLARCDEYESNAGVLNTMSELRAELARANSNADTWRTRALALHAELAKLRAPKKRARKAA